VKHKLPKLPYGYADLEPHIDARTMLVHHSQHHAAYVAKLNSALSGLPELHSYTAAQLLQHLDEVPETVRDDVKHNAGGHLNHSQLWRAMTPSGGGVPGGLLGDAITRDFGDFESFKTAFEAAGAALFGSGWVWLARVQVDGGKLQIYTTTGHDNPIMRGHFPILVNDVWEHAYYLKHENRRAAYLHAWWVVVNWAEASKRYERSDHAAEHNWEDEGGSLLAIAA